MHNMYTIYTRMIYNDSYLWYLGENFTIKFFKFCLTREINFYKTVVYYALTFLRYIVHNIIILQNLSSIY